MRKLRHVAGRALFYLLVAAIVVYALFPLYWAVVSSLKTGSALFEVEFIPKHPTLENYIALFREQPFARNILNSLVVAGSATGLSLAVSISSAYALGRVRFKGRRAILLSVLAVSMFPQIAVLAGMFELIRGLGLYNSLSGLALSNLILTLPFTAWVLTVFMRQVPVELEEAAIADGASPWQRLVHVFLPLIGPPLVATGLISFILVWNEFLFALTFTLTPDVRTVPVAISLISGATAYELPWGRIMAASVIVTLPLVLIVLALQGRIIAGLTAGAVKG